MLPPRPPLPDRVMFEKTPPPWRGGRFSYVPGGRFHWPVLLPFVGERHFHWPERFCYVPGWHFQLPE